MEQDGRGVGGLEVHLLHEYIRNTPSDIEVHGKQEYLTSENEYIEPCKLINSSPYPGIAPQSLNSNTLPLHLPGGQCSCPGYACLRQGLSDSHSI